MPAPFPIFRIFAEPVLRVFVRAYLLFDGVSGPYEAQEINSLHVPAAYGVIPTFTEAREIYPDQAFLVSADVQWQVLGLISVIPVVGLRLRFEPPLEPDLWQHCGVLLFPAPGQLTPAVNGVRASFTHVSMNRPGVS